MSSHDIPVDFDDTIKPNPHLDKLTELDILGKSTEPPRANDTVNKNSKFLKFFNYDVHV